MDLATFILETAEDARQDVEDEADAAVAEAMQVADCASAGDPAACLMGHLGFSSEWELVNGTLQLVVGAAEDAGEDAEGEVQDLEDCVGQGDAAACYMEHLGLGPEWQGVNEEVSALEAEVLGLAGDVEVLAGRVADCAQQGDVDCSMGELGLEEEWRLVMRQVDDVEHNATQLLEDVEDLAQALVATASAVAACASDPQQVECVMRELGLEEEWASVMVAVQNVLDAADETTEELLGPVREKVPLAVPGEASFWVPASEIVLSICAGDALGDDQGVTWKVMAPNGRVARFVRTDAIIPDPGAPVRLDFSGRDLDFHEDGDWELPWQGDSDVDPDTLIPADGTWSIWVEDAWEHDYRCDERGWGYESPVRLDVASENGGSSVCFRHARGSLEFNNPVMWNQHWTEGQYVVGGSECDLAEGDSGPASFFDLERSAFAHRFYVDPVGGDWSPEGFREFVEDREDVPLEIELPLSATSPVTLLNVLNQPHTRLYYLLDDQHSTVGLTDEDGVLVEGYTYSPYGVPTIYNAGANGVVDWGFDDIVLQGGTSPLENRILYTGRSWDEDTGLYYYRTRYMDPDLGRFISSDTIGIWSDSAALGNSYAYCSNAPVICIDISGAAGWKITTGFALGGKLGITIGWDDEEGLIYGAEAGVGIGADFSMAGWEGDYHGSCDARGSVKIIEREAKIGAVFLTPDENPEKGSYGDFFGPEGDSVGLMGSASLSCDTSWEDTKGSSWKGFKDGWRNLWS